MSTLVPSRVTHYRCKTCGNTISAEDLEAIFLEKLREWLTPETIATLLLEADEMVQSRLSLRNSLEKQLSKAQADLDRLFDLHAQGEVPTQGFRRRYQPIEDRCTQLAAEVARVEGELACYQTELLSEEQAIAEAQDLMAGLESRGPEFKRNLIRLRFHCFPLVSPKRPTSLQTARGLGG